MKTAAEKGAARREWGEGWKLVLSSTVGSSLAPLMVYTMGLFVVPLEQEFGWSRTLITSGLTVFAIISVIFAGPAGALIDRYGPRRIALPGALIYCLALALLATASGSRLHWWGLWLLLASGALLVKPTVWSAAIVSRFSAARGLALAIALCGAGLTGIFAPAVAGYLIERVGWRFAYIGIAGLWFLIAMPPLLLFFYGAADLDRVRSRTAAQPIRSRPEGVPFKEAVRSSAFVKLALATFAVMLVVTACMVHFVPMVSEGGLSRNLAVATASAIGLAAFLGRLVTGSLLDRWNATVVGGVVFCLPAVACALLLGLDGSQQMAVLIAVLVGFCSGAEVEVASYLSARFFGMRFFGTLFGIIAGLISLATGIGPVIAGWAFDQTGAYDLALWAAMPTAVIAGILILSLGRQPRFEGAHAAPAPADPQVSGA